VKIPDWFVPAAAFHEPRRPSVTLALPSTPVCDLLGLVSTLIDCVTRSPTLLVLEKTPPLGRRLNAPTALIVVDRFRESVRRRTFSVFNARGGSVIMVFQVIFPAAMVAFAGFEIGTRPCGTVSTRL
jgi:hypothetical protein